VEAADRVLSRNVAIAPARLVLGTGNADQRERIAYLTAAGEAAIEAALPHWRKAQKRIAALVQPSVIAELADQLDALAVREQGRT